jgi:hypothetical protein
MVTGSHNVMNLLLDDICFLAVVTDLMAALKELPIALEHRVMAVRCAVVEGIAGCEVLDGVFRAGDVEGPAHAGEAVGFGDIVVARRASRGVDVASAGSRR